MSLTKKEAQKKLDHLRRDKRSFHRGTPQHKERLRLEMLIDNHLYQKEQ